MKTLIDAAGFARHDRNRDGSGTVFGITRSERHGMDGWMGGDRGQTT